MASGPIVSEESFNEWYSEYNSGPLYSASPDPQRDAAYQKFIYPNLKNAIAYSTYDPAGGGTILVDPGTKPTGPHLNVIKQFWEKAPTDIEPQLLKERFDKYKATLIVASASSAKIGGTDYSKDMLDVFDDDAIGSSGTFDNPSEWRNLTSEGMRTNDVVQASIEEFIEAALIKNNKKKSWTDWFSDDPDPPTGDEALNNLQGRTLEGDFSAANAAARGMALNPNNIPPDTQALEELDTKTQNQCLLMSMLYNSNSFLRGTTATDYNALSGVDPSGNPRYPYYGRILPVDPDSYNPEEGTNYFTSDGLAKHFFAELDTVALEETSFIKELFYVYEDNGEVKEKLFPLSNMQLASQQADKASQAYATGNPSEDEINKILLGIQDGFTDERIWNLKSITVKYDGTNPSTARNDVKVDISFALSNFEVLMKDFVFFEKDGVQKGIGLKDLIVSPISDDGTTYGLSSLKANYSPKHNRVRVKLYPSGRKIGSNVIGNIPIVLDLTTIDHDISRQSDDGLVTLKISYRGFLQSQLNQPYADALISSEGMTSRQKRLENINNIIDDDCSTTTIREIMRIERASFEAETKTVFQNIVRRIYNNKKLYSAAFIPGAINETNQVAARLKALGNVPLAGKQGFVQVKGTSQLTTSDIGDLALQVNTIDSDNDGFFGSLFGGGESDYDDDRYSGPEQTSFFTFGDLLDSLVHNLYDPASPLLKDHLKNLNLKFMTMPFQIPNPADSNGFITLNPVLIPIDLYFFAEWFNSAVVKKELKIYPVASLARDVLERLLNNLLYETCMSHLLPDEKPPRLRMGYFSGNIDHSTTTYDLYTNPDKSKGYFTFAEETPQSSTDEKVIEQYNYCVFYQMGVPFLRELRAQKAGNLYDDDFIPTIITGRYARNYSFVQNVGFHKNTAPFLREARYFNNDFGPLALMNNVYDLKFEITKKMANSYLIPGTIVNLVLADFEQMTMSSGKFQWENTDNDPHHEDNNNPTSAKLLGFGGYFMITSVEYELKASDLDWRISVSGKFAGTESEKITKNKGRTALEIIEQDSPSCITYYNIAVQEYEALEDANLDKWEPIETKTIQAPPAPPNNQQNNNTTQQPSTPPSPPPTPPNTLSSSGASNPYDYFKTVVMGGNHPDANTGTGQFSAVWPVGDGGDDRIYDVEYDTVGGGIIVVRPQ